MQRHFLIQNKGLNAQELTLKYLCLYTAHGVYFSAETTKIGLAITDKKLYSAFTRMEAHIQNSAEQKDADTASVVKLTLKNRIMNLYLKFFVSGAPPWSSW